MKIKMITCATTLDLIKYENGVEYIVGENISESLAKSFIDAKFAVEVVDETPSKTPAKPVAKKKVVKDEQ